jgi:RNA polymerase sigma factor (sigma-70 family)
MNTKQLGELRDNKSFHGTYDAEVFDEEAQEPSFLQQPSALVDALYLSIVRIAGPWYHFRVAPTEVEDRLHDTFVIVFQAVRAGVLRDPKALPGFIRTVLRFQATASIREVRRKRRNTGFSGFDTEGLQGNPEELFAKYESKRLLKLFIERLPERDGEILTRFYLDEQPCDQICAHMNLTPTQFRLSKWRAKERLIQTASRMVTTPPASGPGFA